MRPLLLFAAYVCVGLIFYTNIETKACADTGQAADFEGTGDAGSGSDSEVSNCTTSWTPLDAVYFAVVTMSTVGYGDLSPSTWYSQLFTIFYIFIGILAVFSQLTATVMHLFAPAFDFSRKVLTFVLPQPVPIDLDGNGKNDVLLPPHAVNFYATRLTGPVLMLFALQMLFAGVFSAIEPGWSYGLALYHCLVTATTVGYGDVKITTNGGMVCAIVHILASVIILGAIVGDIDAARIERAAQLFRNDQLTQKFNRANLEKLLSKLDQDGGGVEKFEFVVGMLLEASYVQQSDVDAYVHLFERADLTGDGKLSSADITAAFDRMWPSHRVVHRALARRSTTKDLSAHIRRNPAAVAPSKSSRRWTQAGAKVAGGVSAANNLGPAGQRHLVA